MKSFEFELDYNPAKERPRLTPSGRVFTPRKTKEDEEHISWVSRDAARSAGMKPYCGKRRCFIVEIYVEMVDPEKDSKDVDNIAKAILDGMQKGLVFKNDRVVRRLVVDISPHRNPRDYCTVKVAKEATDGEE